MLAAPLSRTDWATDVALLYFRDYSYKPSRHDAENESARLTPEVKLFLLPLVLKGTNMCLISFSFVFLTV